MLQDPKILDSSSQSDDIIQYLGALIEKMDSLNNLAFTYKSYQKNFKVFNRNIVYIDCRYTVVLNNIITRTFVCVYFYPVFNNNYWFMRQRAFIEI